MKKIIIITSIARPNSGHGRVSLELINFLQKNNFEVLVICSQANEDIKNTKQLAILPDPLSFKKTYLLSVFYLLKLIKYRNELKGYDLIHCIVEPYAFFAFLLSGFIKVKYFLLMHGTYAVSAFQNTVYGFLQKIAYKRAKKIICVSNYTKNKILKHKKLSNLTVIPNGINLESFKNSGIQNSGKENILMSLGAFKERKGFDLIIKALGVVVKDIPEIKCYIGGGAGDSGDYRGYLTELAKRLGVADNIVFFENVADDEIKELYKKAKIFVLTTPSTEYNFEGFGVVYLEANAFGIPVIGSYDSGAEEAIKDGYSGFLTKAKNPDDIAEKIVKLLTDDNLYKEMSRNALLWAKEFSWDNIFKEYIKVYRE